MMKLHKRVLWSSIIGVIVLFLVLTLAITWAKARSPQAKVYFEEDSWDYGTLGIGEEATHVFRFHNTGDTDLEIGNVDSTCSCTTAVLQGKKIKPQAVGELKVSFRENDEKGKLKRTVKVYAAGQSKPMKVLTIRVYVVESYTVKPTQLYFDKNGTKELEISSPADMNLQVTKIYTSSKYLSANVSSSQREGDKSVSRISIRLSAPQAIQKSYDQVTIRTNKKIPEIKVPVLVSSRNSISIQPSKLLFGAVQNGGLISKRAFISVPEGSPSRIQRIECNSKSVSAELVKQNDRKCEVVVKLKPDAPLGIFQDKAMIYTSDPNTPVLELLVYGTVLPR
jgi:hypothetical protein